MTQIERNSPVDESLVVVDAGGTKTAAWVVDPSRAEDQRVIGRGRAAPGNPLSVGFEDATKAIREAIAQAWLDAKRGPGCAASAVLSIAGAANGRLRESFIEWGRSAGFAKRVAVVSDVLPVLAAGTEKCCGVALISGTGSVAFGRAADGCTHLRGGWGFLLGDEGSGYSIGRAALQHTLHALEGDAPRSPLAEKVMSSLGVNRVLELTRAIYGSPHPRVAIAGIAPYVIALADEQDTDAQTIIDAAAEDLADLVSRTAQSIEPFDPPLELAAAGGILLSSDRLRRQLQVELRQRSLEVAMNLVDDPLMGCIRLAGPEFAGNLVDWR